MSASTDAVRAWVVQLASGYVDDCLTALAGGAQNSSPRLRAEVSRFTKVASAADSCQLPNLGTGEAQGQCRLVINDAANALAVFPSSGETINALAANTALSVPAGQSAIFIPPVWGSGAVNWRGAVIP